MKKAAFGMACGLSALFVVVMMLTLYGRSVRQSEAEYMLAQAMDSSLSGVMQGKNRAIKDNEDFVADFLKALLIQANSDSDITVSVLHADYKQGILSVEITEKFRHPNGNPGSVSKIRTVIFDRTEEKAKEPEYCKVGFYTADGEVYKEYGLQKGSLCMMPVDPKKEGKVFGGWRFVNGGTGRAECKRIAYDGGVKNVLACGGSPYTVQGDTKLIAVFE